MRYFDKQKMQVYDSIMIDEDYTEESIDHDLNNLIERLIKIRNEHPNEKLVWSYSRDIIYYPGDPFDSYLDIGVYGA